MHKIIIILLCLLFIMPLSIAWSEKTHKIFAEAVCKKFSECSNNGCWVEVKNGSYVPMEIWDDFEGKILYRECSVANDEVWCKDNCEDCTAGTQFLDRTALNRMDGYLSQAKAANGCSRFHSVGIASYYYLESVEFWNQVKGEKSWCVDPFEDAVQREVEDGLDKDWTVESCGITIFGSDFNKYLDDFVDIIEEKVDIASATINHPTVTETTTQQAQTTTASSDGKCLLENVKYLSKLCGASRTVEGFANDQGYDGFNILFVLLLILLIYIFFMRRR